MCNASIVQDFIVWKRAGWEPALLKSFCFLNTFRLRRNPESTGASVTRITNVNILQTASRQREAGRGFNILRFFFFWNLKTNPSSFLYCEWKQICTWSSNIPLPSFPGRILVLWAEAGECSSCLFSLWGLWGVSKCVHRCGHPHSSFHLTWRLIPKDKLVSHWGKTGFKAQACAAGRLSQSWGCLVTGGCSFLNYLCACSYPKVHTELWFK